MLKIKKAVVGGIAVLVLVGFRAVGEPGGIAIDGDFPGGNILVNGIASNHVWLRQDLRDTAPGVNWFYWQFRARNAGGCEVTFHFTNGLAVGSRGPAVSMDEGRTWDWLGVRAVRLGTNGFGFSYAFPAGVSAARFGVAPGYTQADLDRFLARYADNPSLVVEELCRSRKGRPVQVLKVGRVDEPPPVRVLVTARHHACETMASFSLEGLLEMVLADSARGAWLRTNVQFVVVPFVDKDGVEDGDQGKSRAPHDHWEDYDGISRYAEVAAIRAMVERWPAGSLKFALDMHCPELRGGAGVPGDAETVFFAGSMVTNVAAEAAVFQRLFERERRGPLPYLSRYDIPYGVRWNRQADMASTCLTWQSGLPGIGGATVIEIPYANASGQAVTPATARALGADLGRAFYGYLEGRQGNRGKGVLF